MEIVNSPPTELQVQQGWRKLQPSDSVQERNIFAFQCLWCTKCFSNHKNVKQHFAHCPALHPKDPKNRLISDFFTAPAAEKAQDCKITQDLITLIAVHNIPYTQLNSPIWKQFISDLNPDYVIPSTNTLNIRIKEYADFLENKSYQDLMGQEAGICIDGAGFNIEKYYAVVLVNGSRARLAKVYHVEEQTSAKLSEIVADVFRKAVKKGITITGTCSDNAKNLVAALEGPGDNSLLAKIGTYLLRVSCAAHTSQLSILDIKKIDTTIDAILEDCISLSTYIDKRDKTFHEYLNVERPHFIATRWNSACNVLEFMVNNNEKVNEFIQACINVEKNAYEKRVEKHERQIAKGKPAADIIQPSYPPVPYVPNEWEQLLDALKIIRTFTLKIEGDIVLQQQVFLEARNVNTSLTALEIQGNQFAATLRDAFESRFTKTADLLIAELAWRFTPAGVIEWRNTFHLDMISDDIQRNERAHNHYQLLSERFIQLCNSIFSIENPEQEAFYAFPALFEWWLSDAKVNPGESTKSLWKRMKFTNVQIPGFQDERKIPLQYLWRIAIALTTLPASESICERCFSQIKHLASDLNCNMKSDLFESLATVKMATYFMNKYK